jgi:hypothetical protein
MTMQRITFILILAALIGGAIGPRAAWAASDQTICLDREKLASDMRQAGEMIRQGLEKALGTIDTALRDADAGCGGEHHHPPQAARPAG